jgi:Protein of unknown function (DUF1236)
MKKSLLSTAAAVALFAGTGLVLAQKNEAPTPAPAAQQNAPAEKIAPSMKGVPAKGAETKMPQAKPETTGQAEPRMEPKADKANAEQLPAKNRAKNAQTPVSPAGKNAASDNKADVKASESKSDAKPSAAKAPNQSSQTTGQGAAPRTAANLSVEQRTKISATIKQQNTPRTAKVDFPISIGTHVPRTLHLYRLPAAVVEVYPTWRGYEFILVGNEILVINPRTLEIVAVLEA